VLPQSLDSTWLRTGDAVTPGMQVGTLSQGCAAAEAADGFIAISVQVKHTVLLFPGQENDAKDLKCRI
jgi:hypothetical protein